MDQTIKARVRVGKRRTIVIPKHIAEKLEIDEGSMLEMVVSGDTIILRPEPNAINLALRGRKYVKVSIEMLERVSAEEQEKYRRRL